MYLPKSQIKSNQFTNGGEYTRSDDGQEYKGFYWKDSRGRVFTGKNPTDGPTVSLNVLDNESTEEAGPLNNSSAWTTNFNSDITSQTPGIAPTLFQTKPTDNEYQTGEFQRYFTKKSNQNIYFEISKEDYDSLQKQDSSIQWQLYIPISLPWQISGDKTQVYSVNKQIVLQTEKDQKLPGFRKIFRDNYLQYYKQ